MDVSFALILTRRAVDRGHLCPESIHRTPLPVVQISHCSVHAEGAFSTARQRLSEVKVKLSMILKALFIIDRRCPPIPPLTIS
jgi:hypothetical protein